MSILFSHFFQKNNEIRPQEADFTEMLMSIAVVPKTLYFYGKMPENRLKPGTKTTFERPKSLAIVGSRKPTAYGREISYQLAQAAAKRGVVIVSGLAYGIDSIAHRGALDAGGVTVAVLGTPIDQIYPPAHLGLAREIVEKGGAVMSELPPGAKYHPKTCFLQRNRLIAGLADAVMIPEAAERSGSLNTAAHALEQGRDVYVAPGNIDRALSRGCNRLLQQGAFPYLEPADILEKWFPTPRRTKTAKSQLLTGDNALETAILQALARGEQNGDELAKSLKIEITELRRELTILELKGRIRALGANQWALKG